jgi:signal transduction histidine kinase
MRKSSSATGSPVDEFAASPAGTGAVGVNELRLLQRATSLLLSPAPLDEVLTELMKSTAAAAGARGVAIVFLDPTGKLVPGLNLRLPADYLVASAGERIGCGACGRAIKGGAPVVVADVRTDPCLACVREQALRLGIVAVVAAPIVASDGVPVGALAIHVDRPHTAEDLERSRTYAALAAVILEHKRAEATGHERAAAEAAMQQKQEYLQIVSHDLRNPLSAILTSATLLQHEAGGDEARRTHKQTDIIIRSVRHMDRLITDLLDLSQIESGLFRLRRQRHSVKDLVREATEGIQAQAHQKRLGIEVDVDARVTTVSCDAERLLQVLGNLLGNAVKFTPEDGSIRVGATLRGAAVEFTIADSGIGIPGEQLAHIFDRYWQAQRRARQGIGLGLSIARGIVEAHGGRIRVESTAGVGTTFSFTIPRDAGELAEELAEFFDLPVASARVLLERRQQEQAWGPGPTPGVGLMPVAPGSRHAGAQGFLVRVAAGATYPHHRHPGDEHMFAIQGGIRDDGGAELWEGERTVHTDGATPASTAIGDGECILAAMVMPRSGRIDDPSTGS